MDIYEICDIGDAFNNKRLLKNGKVINEFGMLKDLNNLKERISLLEEVLEEAGDQIYDQPILEEKIINTLTTNTHKG